MTVQIKRAYVAPSADDGQRILIDRLWPRGVSKAKLKLDAWLKEVAPSTELREWFGHDPDKWTEFQKRYKAELKGSDAFAELKAYAKKGKLTLVYSAKDEQHNDAVVLQRLLS